MHKEKAIRYHLLKSLMHFKSHVDVDLYKEVCNSLTITSGSEFWILNWKLNGEAQELLMPKGDVKLYQRGDAKFSKDVEVKNYISNEHEGRRWAKDILKIELEDKPEPLRKVSLGGWGNVLDFISILLLSFTTVHVSQNITLSFVFVFLMLIERLSQAQYRPMIYVFLASILIGANSSFIIINTLMLIYITSRAGGIIKLSAMIASIGIISYILFNLHPDFNFSVYLLLDLVLCSIIFLSRWLRGSHFLLLPLISPWFIFCMSVNQPVEVQVFSLIALSIIQLSDYFKIRISSKL